LNLCYFIHTLNFSCFFLIIYQVVCICSLIYLSVYNVVSSLLILLLPQSIDSNFVLSRYSSIEYNCSINWFKSPSGALYKHKIYSFILFIDIFRAHASNVFSIHKLDRPSTWYNILSLTKIQTPPFLTMLHENPVAILYSNIENVNNSFTLKWCSLIHTCTISGLLRSSFRKIISSSFLPLMLLVFYNK
jgi:hypothetical protein